MAATEMSKEGLTLDLGTYDEALKSLERKVLPEGEYTVEFVDWIPKKAEGGGVLIDWRFRVVDDPEWNDVVIYRTTPTYGKGYVFCVQVLVALGAVWQDRSDVTAKFLDDLRGKTARVLTKIETKDRDGAPLDNPRHVIAKWLSGQDQQMTIPQSVY